jgi:DNA repair exonuclease SbcCD ATPase subunit
MSSDAAQKFSELSRTKTYSEQAVWFLNGFWEEGAFENAEQIYDYTQQAIKLDEKLGKGGNELDEFESHRFLEHFDNTMTVIRMRQELREIDQDNNGKMSLLEFFAHHYKKGIPDVANAPQGGDAEAIAEAQRALDEVSTALASVQAELAALAKAEEENKAAIAELKAQEDAYAAKIAELEAKSSDTSTGVVTRNKAANELSQLKAEDPLPLRKAKITAEAALRRVQKQRKIAEAAEAELLVKVDECKAQLMRMKQSGGVANGQMWFMERELFEADKYLPTNKQQYNHKEAFKYTPV